jgi:hypothetical protein
MSRGGLAKQVDLDRCILWGDHLRVLLNSSHITYGEINELLREKGVFVDTTDKSISVPLLSSCLLTPSEFSRLISRSYSRESLDKYKTDKVTLSAPTSDWKTPILENFEGLIGGISLEPGHEFVEHPTITAKSNDEVEILYTIKREDYSKDWIERELYFTGGIVFSRRKDEVIVELQKTHTSKETDRINSIFARAITTHLKNGGLIKEQKPQSIRFDDFSNEERILFFMLLTGANTKPLTFKELVYVAIVRDETQGSLPPDPAISWMEGKVKKLHISGEKLDQLGLITNEAFHRFCLLVKMNAIYQFQSGGTTGVCSVVFWFGGKSAHERDFSDTELNICIERIPRLDKNAEKEIRRQILRSLSALQDAAMEKILAKRKTDQPATALA